MEKLKKREIIKIIKDELEREETEGEAVIIDESGKTDIEAIANSGTEQSISKEIFPYCLCEDTKTHDVEITKMQTDSRIILHNAREAITLAVMILKHYSE